jgi:sugar lactone lactonase YvrE
MAGNLEMIADYACQTGEGPLWHPDEQCVYWTDIPRGRLYRYDARTGEHRQVYEGRVVGGMTLQADGKLLLFMDQGSVAIWDGTNLEFVIESLPEEAGNRFNDVCADPEGRVFCGTMSNPNTPGRLYRLDPDGRIEKIVEGTRTSNGMGFSPDLSTMYFTDTGPAHIYTFDYDRSTGEIKNQRVLVHVQGQGEGRPDGMAVDAEGCLWSARWDGSCVVRYSPAGEELDRVHLPTKKVTCPAFTGPGLADMVVTTAGGDRREENGPLAGALFRWRPEVGGAARYRSRIRLDSGAVR